MKYLVVGLALLCFFILGICVGSTKYPDFFSEASWTDTGMLLVTTAIFLFGLFTYFQWLNNKKKEDAYLAAKKYILSLGDMEDILFEISFHYNHICPSPGLMCEDKSVSLRRIEHLEKILLKFHWARRNIYSSHRELEFWNVRLTEEFVKKDKELNELLQRVSVVAVALNRQLFYYVSGKDNMSSVVGYKKDFDKLCSEVAGIIKKRVECGFKSVFLFAF